MTAVQDPILPERRTRIVVLGFLGVLLLLELIDVRWRVHHNHSDWWVYWTVARQIETAPDPYAVASPGEDYYIYPPLLAILARPLGALDSEDAATVWHFVNIALLFGCYVEWRRTWTGLHIDRVPRWLLLLVAGVGAFPVVSTMQGGQMNILTLFAILLGCRLGILSDAPRSWMLAGLVLTLPAAIKLSPVLVGAVLVVQFLAATRDGAIHDPRRRGLILAGSLFAGACLWLLVLPALLVGWTRNLQLLSLFADHILVTRANMHATSAANQGVAAMVATYAEWLGHTLELPVSRGAVGVVVAVLAIEYAIPVALAMRKLVRRGRLLDHVVVTTMAAAASLFYSPVSWHAHYTLAIPFLATAPLYFLDAGNEKAARRLAWGVAAVFALQYVLRNLAIEQLPVLGPLFGVCVVWFAVMVLRGGEKGYLP